MYGDLSAGVHDAPLEPTENARPGISALLGDIPVINYMSDMRVVKDILCDIIAM
jgi:hypothetical protein